MANKHRDIDADKLTKLAFEYCEECMTKKKETATGSGKIVDINERYIPTIKYFILHWLRNKDIDIYTRQHIYRVMNDEKHPLCDTIKNIREAFDALAEDIVANEGKGIFFAKNRLGMTDKQETTVREQPLFGDEE